MDARPILETVARVLGEAGLEAILVGNAAAALHGAPVTTIDFDFLFRPTPGNIRKLKTVAKSLDAVILRPYYPASGLFRVVRDRDGLQLDFMSAIDGVKSFEALRAQSKPGKFGEGTLLVADLAAVIASKRAAGRPQDKAVLDMLEKTLDETHAGKPKADRQKETEPKAAARRTPRGN